MEGRQVVERFQTPEFIRKQCKAGKVITVPFRKRRGSQGAAGNWSPEDPANGTQISMILKPALA